MDYSLKTPNNLLRKYQWHTIHNPRISLFGGEEEEVSEEGQFYDGIDFYHLAIVKNGGSITKYSVESTSDYIEIDPYTLTPYNNVDFDGTKKLSYYLGWRYIQQGQGSYTNKNSSF